MMIAIRAYCLLLCAGLLQQVYDLNWVKIHQV